VCRCWCCPRRRPARRDFFNHGAQFYISNHLGQAMQAVTNGLQRYPDDIQLKKLEELLKQQSQSKNSQQQDQQSSSKSRRISSPKKTKSSRIRRTSKSSKPIVPREEASERTAAGEESSGAEKQEPPSSPQSAVNGQMSPKEAQQLLDSQKNDELMLPVSRKEKASDQPRPIKDW